MCRGWDLNPHHSGDTNIGVVLMVKSIHGMLNTGDCIARIRGLKRQETVVTAITEKMANSSDVHVNT